MPKTILCADDSATMQTVAEITFRKTEYEYVGARSADEALAQARALRPALVLADAVMPDKTGYDLCLAIKSDPALGDVPVMVMCGNAQAYDVARGEKVGADGHVTKPWDSQSMLDKVAELLARLESESPNRPGEDAPAPAAGNPAPPAPAAKAATTPPPSPAKAPATPPAAKAAAAPARTEPPAKKPAPVPSLTATIPPVPAIKPRPAPAKTPAPAPAAAKQPTPTPPPSPAKAPSRPPAAENLTPTVRSRAITAPPALAAAKPQPRPKPAVATPPPRAGIAPAMASPARNMARPPHRPPMIKGSPRRRAGTVDTEAATQVRNVPARSATLMGMPLLRMPPATRATPPGVTPVSPIAEPAPAIQNGGGHPAPETLPASPPPPAVTPIERAEAAVSASIPAAAEAVLSEAGLDPAGPEAAALVKLSREVVERVVWEVVPDLAEAIIRENLDRLTAKSR